MMLCCNTIAINWRTNCRTRLCVSHRLPETRDRRIVGPRSHVCGSAGALEVGKRVGGGVGTAHAVRTRARRGGRRTDVHPRYPKQVGVLLGAWSKDQLADVFGSGDDVSADIVGVVHRHLGGRSHRRPTIRSRNPGANRSIWAVIASVASPV